MSTDNPSDLSLEEIQISLKALGYYQVHLFDELSGQVSNKEDIELEISTATSAIKKIHSMIHKKGP